MWYNGVGAGRATDGASRCDDRRRIEGLSPKSKEMKRDNIQGNSH